MKPTTTVGLTGGGEGRGAPLGVNSGVEGRRVLCLRVALCACECCA